MKYLKIIRGAITGVLIFAAAQITASFIVRPVYPIKPDAYYIDGVGSYSPASALLEEKLNQTFFWILCAYTVLYSMWFLYMRRRYFKKHPEQRK